MLSKTPKADFTSGWNGLINFTVVCSLATPLGLGYNPAASKEIHKIRKVRA